MENIKSFTPKCFFNPNTEKWENTVLKGNWITKSNWIELVKNIIQLTDDLILVIWLEKDEGGQNTQTIYKGVLEFN